MVTGPDYLPEYREEKGRPPRDRQYDNDIPIQRFVVPEGRVKFAYPGDWPGYHGEIFSALHKTKTTAGKMQR